MQKKINCHVMYCNLKIDFFCDVHLRWILMKSRSVIIHAIFTFFYNYTFKFNSLKYVWICLKIFKTLKINQIFLEQSSELYKILRLKQYLIFAFEVGLLYVLFCIFIDNIHKIWACWSLISISKSQFILLFFG